MYMKQVKNGSVIFNKRSKMFDGNNDDGTFTHELSEAYIYEDYKQAENELLNNFDEPDNYKIWNIEIIYKTLDD